VLEKYSPERSLLIRAWCASTTAWGTRLRGDRELALLLLWLIGVHLLAHRVLRLSTRCAERALLFTCGLRRLATFAEVWETHVDGWCRKFARRILWPNFRLRKAQSLLLSAERIY
jgi:hypothetical protein